MSGEDPHAPHHGCGHEGTCSFSLCKISAHHSTSLTSVAVCSPQLRIPTCYDKPGTSQLVQSTPVWTAHAAEVSCSLESHHESNLSFTERQSGVHRSAHRPWSGSLQVEHVYCVLVWLCDSWAACVYCLSSGASCWWLRKVQVVHIHYKSLLLTKVAFI